MEISEIAAALPTLPAWAIRAIASIVDGATATTTTDQLCQIGKVAAFDIASIYGLNIRVVRRNLAAWRKKHDEWCEVTDRSARPNISTKPSPSRP